MRAAAFTVILAFMAFGPFYRQVLRGDQQIFRHWVMFSGIALGVVDATYRQRHRDGTEIEIDRFAALGYAEPRDAPRSIRLIKGRSGTDRVAEKLCRRLGPDADIRVTSRWASRQGWRPGYRGNRNFCRILK